MKVDNLSNYTGKPEDYNKIIVKRMEYLKVVQNFRTIIATMVPECNEKRVILDLLKQVEKDISE